MLDDNPNAVPMAGGLDVVTGMKIGAGPRMIVWLGDIGGTASPVRDGYALVLPAGCRHDQFVQSGVAVGAVPDLVAAWSGIANIRIRSQGTVVGNVMAGVAGYEAAVLLMAADARLVALSPGGAEHVIEVSALGRDSVLASMPWLVTSVRIPLGKTGEENRLFYDRSLRPALSVALSLTMRGGTILRARAVLGGCHPRPVLRELPLAGVFLDGLRGEERRIAGETFGDLPSSAEPCSGTPDYPLAMAPVLLSRMLKVAS